MPVRILIVDDNDIVRKAMKKILESDGKFEVCGEACNGDEAIRCFRALKPDCVVLDFSMPVMSGIDAAREITQMDPTVPLLMCTMFKSDELTRAAHQVGVKRIVSKSEKLSVNLVNTIEALVASRRAS